MSNNSLWNKTVLYDQRTIKFNCTKYAKILQFMFFNNFEMIETDQKLGQSGEHFLRHIFSSDGQKLNRNN